jgi:hypothetical protein
MTGLEYFYSAHLGYSYLGSARFMETSWAANRPIAYKPMDLCDPVTGTTRGRPTAWRRNGGTIFWDMRSPCQTAC